MERDLGWLSRGANKKRPQVWANDRPALRYGTTGEKCRPGQARSLVPTCGRSPLEVPAIGSARTVILPRPWQPVVKPNVSKNRVQPANSLQAKCFVSRAVTGSELVAVQGRGHWNGVRSALHRLVERMRGGPGRLSDNGLFGRQVFVSVIDADGDRVLAGLDRVGLELEGKFFGVE